MNSFTQTLKGLFLITTGGGGAAIAVIEPWQEHLEWSMRIALLIVSIVSVSIGLWVTTRRKHPPKQ